LTPQSPRRLALQELNSKKKRRRGRKRNIARKRQINGEEESD
jgi:hypothetical protein